MASPCSKCLDQFPKLAEDWPFMTRSKYVSNHLSNEVGWFKYFPNFFAKQIQNITDRLNKEWEHGGQVMGWNFVYQDEKSGSYKIRKCHGLVRGDGKVLSVGGCGPEWSSLSEFAKTYNTYVGFGGKGHHFISNGEATKKEEEQWQKDFQLDTAAPADAQKIPICIKSDEPQFKNQTILVGTDNLSMVSFKKHLYLQDLMNQNQIQPQQ